MTGSLRGWLEAHPKTTATLCTATWLLAQATGLALAGGSHGGNGP